MKILVRALKDEASVNIADKLENTLDFEEDGDLEGHPVQKWRDWLLVTTPDYHIENEHLDRRISEAFGEPVELMVFLSRHRSESGARSLTVHPPGNPGGADLGGIPRTLVPAAPHEMTAALRSLLKSAEGLDYAITFEVTHHGPSLDVPTFFIEIGSSTLEWNDDDAGIAVAKAVISIMNGIEPAPLTLVGIGGGHYAPRFSEVVQDFNVSIGHMLPTYQIDNIDPPMIEQAMERSNADGVYLHRKSMRSEPRRRIIGMLEDLGIRVYRAGDLVTIEGS
jgi:D-aminoacyl-tRNA deacylase